MKDYLQAIITVLSLVNPAICAAIFSQLEVGQSYRAKVVGATKAAVANFVILLLAALFGARLLHEFGVSLDAFKVAGGGVLAWMGFSMLRGDATDSESAKADADGGSPSLTSLIMFAAIPGTITGVITLSVVHARLDLPVTAIVAVAVAVTVAWCIILLVARLGGKDNAGSFVRETVTRFMGTTAQT